MSANAARILDAVHAGGAPAWATYLPNLNALGHERLSNGHIAPLYGRAPAPMGVSDLGLRDVANVIVPYSLNTSSIEGSIDLSSVSPFYLDASGPYDFGIQLNTVVANATLFGNDSYSFWTQNVVQYLADVHQLIFIDNVWNFSSPSGFFPTQSILSGNGTLVADTYYYAIGPTINISTPFVLNLYTNTTVESNNTAVYFNYTLTNATGHTLRGSYDDVEFNSASLTTRPAHYLVSGYNYTPLGLPYDAELVLGGPGGGSTSNINGILATMTLAYWNATLGRFASVPSAYGYGTDTGETVSGVAEWYSLAPTPTAHLGAGPSFLLPMWNAGGTAGVGILTVVPTPRNAWIFMTNNSTYNATDGQWAPTSPTAPSQFFLSLTVRNYNVTVMLADYAPMRFTYSTATIVTVTATLVRDPGLGVYTPLVAWSNSELAGISSGGNGTVGNPYKLVNNEYGTLSVEFSQFNDFLFPVFFGVLLVNTNDYVQLDRAPSFQVYFNDYMINTTLLGAIGFPTSNELQIEMYNATHVSLTNAPDITGWFYAGLDFYFPMANVLAWNSSDLLIAGNTFVNLGSSVTIYGGSNNTIWGNYFLPAPTALSAAYFNYPYASGITLYGSGDLVYNNYFGAALPVPAQTPTFDLYTGFTVFYRDSWNVTPQPASHVRLVNGIALSGNILGYATQGGNYWWNYGIPPNQYGTLPYSDQLAPATPAISVGGDFDPLTAPLYHVRFVESGLPAGQRWDVQLNTTLANSTLASIGFWDPAGSYSFQVSSAGNYAVSPGSGVVTVTGSDVTVAVRFVSQFTYPTQFTETGLPTGSSWSVSVGTLVATGSSPVLSLALPNGSYSYGARAPDYLPLSGGLTVNGAAQTIALAFQPRNATVEGVVTPANATLTIDGVSVTLTAGSFSAVVLPGLHALEAKAQGYYPYFNNVSAGANRTVNVSLTLTAIPSPATRPAQNATGPSETLVWAIAAGLVVVAVAIVVAALLLRSSRGGGGSLDEPRSPGRDPAADPGAPGGSPPPSG